MQNGLVDTSKPSQLYTKFMNDDATSKQKSHPYPYLKTEILYRLLELRYGTPFAFINIWSICHNTDINSLNSNQWEISNDFYWSISKSSVNN